MFYNPFFSGWIHVETKARSKTDCSNHAQTIFKEAFGGISYSPYNFCCKVCVAVDVVYHFFRLRVVEHSINRKIAALRIFLGRGFDNFGGLAAAILKVCAEGGDLELMPLMNDDDDAKGY